MTAETNSKTPDLHELAKVYAASYASPHHITFTLGGLRHLVAALTLPDEPVAKVISWTNGSYSRNYKLEWLKNVPEGASLYATPQPAEPKAAPVERKPLGMSMFASRADYDAAVKGAA